MFPRLAMAVGCVATAVGLPAMAVELDEIQAHLKQEVIGPHLALEEVQSYCEAAVPPMPVCNSAAEWQAQADRMRRDALENVVYRGEAAGWRDADTRIEWQETIEGGPGYRIRKLRFEALPGLWIPALLYEPDPLEGKMPVFMNVNGHEGPGKAVLNKQLRSINMAKRGIITLNADWFGMGQLTGDNFRHYRLNQIDLCGTSGLAPFYLAMKRGLDLLLAHEHADPQRVGVSGLSGGGWQTIIISSLDERVTLANPVAGYSSFRTRARNFSDLGDSEQTPVDLAVYADYAQLTGMRAPRPTLLTFNAADNCCFQADHALPPLLDSAGPVYRLFGKESYLRSHVNHDPGTHNFDQDNREALYQAIGDFFYGGSASFNTTEIPSEAEVKTPEELAVELPADNLDFHQIAVGLAQSLPRDPDLPGDKAAALSWQARQRQQLRETLRVKREFDVAAEARGSVKEEMTVTLWQLRLDHAWTVPAVELAPPHAKGTTILLADDGRASAAARAQELLSAGQRVLAVDPFYFGESKIESHDSLFALLISAVGDRPLGIQAAQIAAISRWAAEANNGEPVTLAAIGPRLGLAALCAAGLEEKAIDRLELDGAMGSLKEVIEENKSVEQAPELFCFGMLADFDIPQLTALAAPRPVLFRQPSDRAKSDLAGLKTFYATLGADFDPLQ